MGEYCKWMSFHPSCPASPLSPSLLLPAQLASSPLRLNSLYLSACQPTPPSPPPLRPPPITPSAWCKYLFFSQFFFPSFASDHGTITHRRNIINLNMQGVESFLFLEIRYKKTFFPRKTSFPKDTVCAFVLINPEPLL